LSCARKLSLSSGDRAAYRSANRVLRVLDCSVAVDRLEKKHLLKRTPHHTDRRAFLIELTPEGEACFKEHHEFHLKMTRKIVSGLTASEQKTFADVIEKILKKI
jgi:DNA-binding MarR family transcriptional regulator